MQTKLVMVTSLTAFLPSICVGDCFCVFFGVASVVSLVCAGPAAAFFLP